MPSGRRLTLLDGFGARLRRARQQAGFSQKDLERRSGIPKSRISRYENGHLLPSLAGLQRLCRSLGIPDADLLGEGDVYAVFVRTLRARGVRFSSRSDAERAAAKIAPLLAGREREAGAG